MRSVVNRARTSAAPARPICTARFRSAASSARWPRRAGRCLRSAPGSQCSRAGSPSTCRPRRSRPRGSRRRAPRSRRQACPRSRTSGGKRHSLRSQRATSRRKPRNRHERGDAELGGEPLDVGAVGAVAEHDQRRTRLARVQRRERPDQIERALDRGRRPANPMRNDRAGARARLAGWRAVAAVLRFRCERSNPYGITSIGVGRRDAERDQIVAYLVGDGDEGTRPAGEPSLDLDRQPHPARSEVTPEAWPWKGGRSPAGAAALASAQPSAGRPGFGRMRVQDVRVPAPDRPSQLANGRVVSARSDSSRWSTGRWTHRRSEIVRDCSIDSSPVPAFPRPPDGGARADAAQQRAPGRSRAAPPTLSRAIACKARQGRRGPATGCRAPVTLMRRDAPTISPA